MLRNSRYTLLLQVLVLLLLVLPFVSGTFRDNDQATLLDSSWVLAHHQSPFWHALFYNFDKQWGVFLALSWLFRLLPGANPILSGNILLTVLASLAWLSLGIRTGRTRNAPLPLLLPILLCPVLVLYIPYLGTGWFSLALLLLAYFFLGRIESKASQVGAIFLVAAAAACRGDVVLAIPALLVSRIPRVTFLRLLRTPLTWLLSAAAILPVLAGKLMAGANIPDANPFSFDLRAYAGYLLFGLTPAVLILLAGSVSVFLRLAIRRRRFRFFYLLTAIAPLMPLGFYSPQLYTLRYFFLTLASILFLTTSRRSIWLYRQFAWLPRTLIVVSVLPWIVGISLPLLTHPGLTFTNPTRFPTGDGRFPMGAYLGFAWQVRTRDHLAIDHNENMWLAAKSVDYAACSGAAVPFLITPMSNYVQLAIRLQGKNPLPIDYLAESPCGRAYVDARSILRGFRPDPRDGRFFDYQIEFVSSPQNGQLIAEVNLHGEQTEQARILQRVRQTLGPRQIDIYAQNVQEIKTRRGLRYTVFSSGPCRVEGSDETTWMGSGRTTKVQCDGAFAGWAYTTLPPVYGPLRARLVRSQ